MRNKPNILIVDDISANIVALKRILPKDDINIIEATSGKEALRLAMELPLALALLDVMMPEMNGYELAELLQGAPLNDHVPIIFITANANEQKDLLKGYNSGAVDYITKPINVQVLRSKIKIFLELYNLQQNQQDLNEQLNEANWAKSRFIETINHELRTPMDGTLGMLELILSTELTDKQRGYAQSALGSGNNILKMMDNIFEFNMVESGKIPINNTIFNAHDLLQYIADVNNERLQCDDTKGTVITSSELGDLAPVLSDTTIITEVASNMIHTALDSSTTKLITLRGKLKEENERTAEILFEIHDPSSSLSSQEAFNLSTSFEKHNPESDEFHTNHNLSLAISDATIRFLGGEMGISSTEGNGTTYWFSLPVKKAPTQTTTQQAG